MRIGIIGTGRVGTALQSGWTDAGHDVRTGSRSSSLPLSELALWADVLVLAVPFAALETVASGIAPAKGKIIVDCTNPIRMGPDGMALAIGHTASGAEYLQGLLPGAHVIKSLNQVGAEVMADTIGFALPPVQFMAGDKAEAKETVAALLTDLGFEPLDAGALSKARLLEPFALVWINQAIAQAKGRNWAFGAMPRDTQA